MQDIKSLYKTLPKGLLFLSIYNRILIRDLLLKEDNLGVILHVNWDGSPFQFVHELIIGITNYYGVESVTTSSVINSIVNLAIDFESNESIKAELLELINS